MECKDVKVVVLSTVRGKILFAKQSILLCVSQELEE